MIPRRKPFIAISQTHLSPTQQCSSTANRPLNESEVARFIEDVCADGDCLHLRSQQRVPLPPPGKVVVLREGMLAIDAMPAKGKLQVLDFLVAGDVLSAATVLPAPGVSLRAITSASLVSLDPPPVNRVVPSHDYWAFLVMQCHNQMARANIHQLLIGRLETEQRVASFILALALRNNRKESRSVSVELPMSRTDIANYLVINCDTLSRTMMRFCDSGLIERESRHAIRVVDIDVLKKKSPLASLLSAMFEKRAGREELGFERHAEASAPAPVDEDHSVAPLVLTVAGLARSPARYPYSSRGGL
ncbi:Crp/Fnr family transcriptional regulator [Bradyrhizobium sp. CB1650]|uniref:Crp/Fnr family transcriptional regulator n=1 Tax=Bradyrhizobium sp. CB1650 TaxID=3039153 RepID=UPI0024350A02|nr:Crp/Fnr family transcriptional regulator [Bradyrhizobium sp. CB1650]WGD49470.1 Crp/Fnr family transcriptional regulator [Bradyrhizobium sp. CB1650]